ncbi:LysM peptidoglycan-binding domain-containing protein [Thalassobacillus sp. CUG 92003]|uniref:LysM peptidoglycan-binding domain-containing protein n=1 Tax=Thalassobacillus sp. CUG 92003 TaxID=2736641 RepID=UPI0015E6FD3E|nr:LysM peptidoglycan-binding domain-containing protein [Thalassobacillus sp. CUG 92003]
MPINIRTQFIYTVQPGDTLYAIAARFGSEVALIEEANALYPPITDPGLIFPGQVLVVPSTSFGENHIYQTVNPGGTLFHYAQRYNTNVDLLQGINPQIGDPNYIFVNQALLVPAFSYEVVQGDTLYAIARRFDISLSTLLEANRERPGLSEDVIYPGFRVIVPLPSSINIVVFRPYPGTKIQEGQPLEGFARAFEGTILYRIVDSADEIVSRETSIQTSAGAPAYGTFSKPIAFDNSPTTSRGELWVYTRSARDGSIQDLVQMPVRF